VQFINNKKGNILQLGPLLPLSGDDISIFRLRDDNFIFFKELEIKGSLPAKQGNRFIKLLEQRGSFFVNIFAQSFLGDNIDDFLGGVSFEGLQNGK